LARFSHGARELKDLQKEDARLKRPMTNQALDMEIFKEAAKGNWLTPSAGTDSSLSSIRTQIGRDFLA
jgi:hypothetical protein